MKLWKDLLVGVVAGVVAAGAMGLRRPKVEVPQGIYQAQLDLPARRELEAALRGGAGSAGLAQQRLRQKVEKFDVKDGALDGLLSYLTDAAGVEIAPEWGMLADAGVPRNAMVSVRFGGGTAADALRATLKAASPPGKPLAFQAEGDTVRVSTYAELSKELFTRVYDVRDVIRGVLAVDRSLYMPKVPPGLPLDKWPRPDGLFTGPLDFADFAGTPTDAVDLLVREIQTIVDPPSWRDAGGSIGGVNYFAGELIITQTRANHDQIAAVLETMRAAMKGK